jgi:hypothetical protein
MRMGCFKWLNYYPRDFYFSKKVDTISLDMIIFVFYYNKIFKLIIVEIIFNNLNRQEKLNDAFDLCNIWRI